MDSRNVCRSIIKGIFEKYKMEYDERLRFDITFRPSGTPNFVA